MVKIMETLIKKSVCLNNKTFVYYRPSQVRKIPLKAISNRGFMPSLKSHIKQLILGETLILEYESQLEHDFLLLLDHDPNCIDLQTQPIKLTYTTTAGKNVPFYPDCWAIFKDKREFLFDIATETKMQKRSEDKNWDLRIEAIQEFCKKMRWTYQVFTEKKIQCVRLNNIKDLLMAAKHFSPITIKKDLGKFNTVLKKILMESPKKFRELVNLLSIDLPHLELEDMISLLKYKIYFFDVFIDWDKLLEETLILPDGEFPSPVYDLPIVSENDEDCTSIIITEKDEKPVILLEKEQKKFEERLKLITPFINKFGKEAKYSEIIDFCKKNNLPLNRTYKLYLKWKKEGDEGLFPNKASKHEKSHLDPRVEQLLQDAVTEWNTGDWRNIISAFTAFCSKCYKSGLTKCSYTTFRKRIENLPAVEMKGKFRPKTQSFIKRNISGTYQEGRYPGCIIQMDHTKLDIWLADSFENQPFGRPWITVGVDPFSRSIWSLYVSYDAPSQETVVQAILNGLIPKDQLKEWQLLKRKLNEKGIDPDKYKLPCSGFPSRIQFDNSKEFQAKLIKKLLMDLNITLEFRPVKTPEYGGFIESVWDTINSQIRGELLEGRVYPLPKTQKAVSRVQFKAPPGYDPKKYAAITINDFRAWLFQFISINYSTTPRAHQNLSPNEKWIHGLRGSKNLPMGGALRVLIPSEYQKMDFQSKIPHSSILSEKGLRYNNILYTSEWLAEARKKRVLKDKQEYEFRISSQDIRTIQMLNPETNEIEILEAYKYDGDDAITKYILQGLGKIPGIRSFRISLGDIKEAKKNVGTSDYDGKKEVMIMEALNEDLRRKVKLTKKEQKHFEKLAETEEGRLKLIQAKVIAQLDDKPFPAAVKNIDNSNVPKKENVFVDIDKLENYPTEWKKVKKQMRISFLNSEEDKY